LVKWGWIGGNNRRKDGIALTPALSHPMGEGESFSV
jgi:hypothetical protein